MDTKVLVADDHLAWRDLITRGLAKEGILCHQVQNKSEAITALSNHNYEVVCLNWTLVEKSQGRQLLQYIRENYSGIRVILISADFRGDVNSMTEKCSNLTKQFTPIIETCFNKDEDEEWQSSLSDKVKSILDHPKLRWAHISDLHIENTDYTQNRILEELIHDMSSFTPLDFVVVSGDLAYSGNKAEYSKVKKFLNELIEDTGLDKQRLFLVPGNHDVDWNAIKQIDNLGVQSFLTSSQQVSALFTNKKYKINKNKVFERLSNYIGFINDYFHDYPEKNLSTDRYFINEFITKIGVGKISISCLNSAWSSAINFDYAKWRAFDLPNILIGEHQVNACLDFIKREKAKLNIAIIHHPGNWLSEFDHDRCWNKLENNFHLILHGHEHVTAANASIIRKSLIFGVGASTQKDKTSGDDKYYNGHNRYHLSELDCASGQGTQFLRRFSSDLGVWIRDIETSPDQLSEIPFTIKF